MIVNEKEIKDDRNELFYNLYEKEYDRQLEIKNSIESRSGIMIALIGTVAALFFNGINLDINFTEHNLNTYEIIYNIVRIILIISIFVLLFISFYYFCKVLTTKDINVLAIKPEAYKGIENLDKIIEDINIQYKSCFASIKDCNKSKALLYKKGLILIQCALLLITILGIILIF
ncbi:MULTISPECIES: hypothetical protein [Clostridium]|uniref:hypothetical protein n=1 Tax=Clostridium TaxID=1485 RepID=UPI000C0718AA|nr:MULTISPECIES: hypothetical protein [Clostridium]MDU4727976.1 hypothetical protein [Clostridium sp.]DAL22428.1 MAG TPA_asm: hypothetical protein [Caudoviricetes sp.]DAU43750.1 MAG TPA: hypothetical protein [Caudoviricetes sp.]